MPRRRHCDVLLSKMTQGIYEAIGAQDALEAHGMAAFGSMPRIAYTDDAGCTWQSHSSSKRPYANIAPLLKEQRPVCIRLELNALHVLQRREQMLMLAGLLIALRLEAVTVTATARWRPQCHIQNDGTALLLPLKYITQARGYLETARALAAYQPSGNTIRRVA